MARLDRGPRRRARRRSCAARKQTGGCSGDRRRRTPRPRADASGAPHGGARLDALLEFNGDLGAAAGDRRRPKALEWVKSRRAPRSSTSGPASQPLRSAGRRRRARLRARPAARPTLIKQAATRARAQRGLRAGGRRRRRPGIPGGRRGAADAETPAERSRSTRGSGSSEDGAGDRRVLRRALRLRRGRGLAAHRARLARRGGPARAAARLGHEQHEPGAGVRAVAGGPRAAVPRRRAGRQLAVVGSARVDGERRAAARAP